MQAVRSAAVLRRVPGAVADPQPTSGRQGQGGQDREGTLPLDGALIARPTSQHPVSS